MSMTTTIALTSSQSRLAGWTAGEMALQAPRVLGWTVGLALLAPLLPAIGLMHLLAWAGRHSGASSTCCEPNSSRWCRIGFRLDCPN
jgi:hypothetical protein